MDRTLSCLLRTIATPACAKPVVLKKPPKIRIPRREPSDEFIARPVIFVTPDKLTCAECECYPYESPYTTNPKLTPFLTSPPTLYRLSCVALSAVWAPDCFLWDVRDVARWMDIVVDLPQYQSCIYANKIDGRKLMMLENPSNLPKLNITNHEHIQIIVDQIHELFFTEVVKFDRSIGLPPRYPLTHCRLFHSRSGPRWGIRRNWSRPHILRWMKIIGPKPLKLDHWDLVWYEKPEFPKTKIARIPPRELKSKSKLWYKEIEEFCNEYQTPRKFRVERRYERQYIWMEHQRGSPSRQRSLQYVKDIERKAAMAEQKLRPKVAEINLDGLSGKELILARRAMPKPKFLPK